ncbi:hypothetical protein [Aeromonas sp. 1HA1]|uniref:hypothetical protein n=1 Tax=Aeromonas sp. 1HA1 TaxID=2699193 RepID=UPI0023DDEFAB|nr:hypothetical protein [Aeromonas sp. 1HA1]MDF2413054.1 hypothetical protein [Aeromonas sp. 1HA1]
MKKKHVFIQSDLGNGKSVFLSQVSAQLALNGYNVWEMTDFEGHACKDLDILAQNGEHHIIVIDEVSDQGDFLDYYTATLPNNITLLLSDRSVSSFSNIEELSKCGIELRVLSLDKLSDDEIGELIVILDDQNLWKRYATWSKERKNTLIRETYNSQLANVLLELLKSPDIKGRISSLIDELLRNDRHKKTLLSIALCDVFGIRKEPSNISDIAGNEDIFTAKLRGTNAFKSLFLVNADSTIVTKSSILSLFIINSLFTENYVVEHCLEIMSRIDHRDEYHFKRLHSKLRTFHNVEKLLPQKQSHLNNYFAELKRRCTWLRQHPHYWVQYAMCRLSFGDILQAQEHLTSAYDFATKRPKDYHTDNIDTQQARLFLMAACDGSKSPSEIAIIFDKAHRLLSNVKNDNHRFRQVVKYEEVYQKSYFKINRGQQANFEHACKAMLENAIEARNSSTAAERTNNIEKSIIVLTEITESIKEKREIKKKR